MMLPWTVVHKPKSVSDVLGNPDSVMKFTEWMRSWDKKIPSKRAAFLYGPPGVGKTVVAESYANENGYDLIEMNASDWRTAEAVDRVAGSASMQATLYGTRKRMVIVDELDGIGGAEDRGGLGAILDVVKTTQCPIVLIANNVWDQRFTYLRNYCLLIDFKRIPWRSIVPFLRKICDEERIEAEEEALRIIAERSRGDVRSAINDLQALAQGRNSLKYEDVSWLAYRDRQESIFEVLHTIFTTKSSLEAKRAVDKADVDYELLFEWIYENIPYQLTDLQDMNNAMQNLAKADIYLKRIRNQEWGLLGYFFDLMTSGIAMSRERTPVKWVPFNFPQRIKLLSQTKKERQIRLGIGRRIGARCHTSARSAVRDYLPYLQLIFEKNTKMASELAEWFNFDEGIINYLAGKGQKIKEDID